LDEFWRTGGEYKRLQRDTEFSSGKMLIPSGEVPVLKKGVPFHLPAENETAAVGYIPEMLSIGFGSSATSVRPRFLYFKEKRDRKGSFNNVPDLLCFTYDEKSD
jgi:hypothetical protein